MGKVLTKSASEDASSIDMLKAMVGIGVFCAFLIVITYDSTLPRIEKLKAEALEKAVFNVIPGATNTHTFQLDPDGNLVPIEDEGRNTSRIFGGYDDQGRLMGVAIEASGQGYADVIRILYGYNPETQRIIGFYVLESKETPGLGDKIEKEPDFLENFKELDVSLTNDYQLKNVPVTVKQGSKQNDWEIDGITGATISSRAIGNIIGSSAAEVLPAVYKNKSNLLLPEK